MSGDINVDFDAVKQRATRLKTVHDQVVNELGIASRQMRDLESNGFKTPQASQKFQQLFAEWQNNCKQLLQTMRETSDAMNTAMQRHEETEQRHAADAAQAIDPNAAGA